MLLLVPCLLLLARGTTQNPQNSGSIANHGSHTPPEYRTNFSCVGRVAGYYADIESGCQLYHLCDADGRRFTHACPNETLFQQRMMICDHWYMVNCNKSVNDYSANLLIGQRDKPFVGADHNHQREPVSFFSISSLQQPNWFPVVGNRSGKEQEVVVNTVPKSPSTISSVHIAYSPSVPPPSFQPPNKENSSPQPSLSSSLQPPIKEYNSPRPQPPSERQARNRNFYTAYKLSVPTPTSKLTPPEVTSRTVDRRTYTSLSPENVSVYPQNPQTKPTTIPDVYKSNPFFQSLVSKSTTPHASTPQFSTTLQGNTKVQINNTAQQQNIDSRRPTTLQDFANLRVSHSQPLPQQVTHRKTKEFSFNFDNNRTHNLQPNRKIEKAQDDFTYNPYVESLSIARTPEKSALLRSSTPAPNFSEDDLNNIVELHLLDPRRMFFIPESKTHEVDRGNSTVLFISVPAPVQNKNNHGVMQFRKTVKVLKGQNPDCPECHPGFLVPGRCYPCVVIR